MTSVASIKDRLKNKSIATCKTMQELFTLYGLERTIYRLSISQYVDNFTLKGGIFLYALYQQADRNVQGSQYARFKLFENRNVEWW